ncbi:MAG: deoxyguanosinetriphosphate triphosphohydrolase [Candidatus Aminicenantes bacterium]|nr:deoxyguanosinetriphosphate triphosphohydrolase [Candidatus Aminicenantes bacterium]TET20486.1 MAG: deoxyguanosinetriphosphate triphosphohydrolase [Candidatus Aminicenantes bacterium]
MVIREKLEEIEKETLSEKACLSSHSRGRERAEKLHPIRTAFQRDRDRIIHSKSFRRLKHKTQVFLAPFGDHYRTRLTHTLEVSQIARTIAKALRLNEDLTEAIALSHDIGHTPFGHAGEKILAELLPDGFSHHEQSLRVVEKLEYEGKGLNLTFEVRDGILKHSKGRGEILSENRQDMPLTLEGQVVRVSDIIAYVNHDIDDALRARVIKKNDIPSHLIQILGKYHASRIDKMVKDVIEASMKSDMKKIAMSGEIRKAISELRDFLYERVYFNPYSKGELEKTEKILTDLYEYVLRNPDDYIKPYPKGDSLAKRAGDFIAGMTDLYALRLYEKFFFPHSWPIV